MLSFPVILGDIGGTFTRFAVLSQPGSAEVLLSKSPTGSHPDVVAALRDALRLYEGPRPRSALFAAAGPVSAGSVRLTNADWTIDPAVIGPALGFSEVILVNDYTATAASLPRLCHGDSSDVRRVGACGDRDGPQVVLGPGTGLGAAALLPFGNTKVIQPTEAGHVELGPVHDAEFRLWPWLEKAHGRITAETLLSGPGIVRLYRALARARGVQASLDSPAAIVTSGLQGDELACDALRMFVSLLGRFAGDLALIFGATGGVFIAGGIAPRIEALLVGGAFRAEFERKAPFNALMRLSPTYLILRAEPVLAGLSEMAANPAAFLMRAAHWTERQASADLADP